MKDDIAADNSHLLRRGSAVPISSDNEISMEIDSGGSSFVKKSSESSANSDSYQEESQSIQTVDDYQEDSNAVPLSFVMKKSQQQGDKIINQFTLSDSSRSSSMPETVTADSKLQISDSSSPTYGFEQNPVCFGTITLDVRQNCNIDFQLTSSSLSSLSETINESQSQSLLDQQQNLINQEQQQLRLQSEQKSQSDSEQQQLTSQQLSLIKQIAQVKLLNQLDTQLEFSEQDLTDDELWQVLDMGTNGDDDDTAGELIVEAMVGSNSHKMDSNAVVNQDDNAKTISQRYKERNQNIKNIFDGLSKRGQNVHNINQNDNIYNIHKNVLGRFNKYPNQFLNVLQIIYHYFNSDRSVEIGPIDTWFDTEARKQYWRDNVQRIRPDGQAADSYDTYEYTNQVTKMYYNEMPYINIKVPQWAVDLNIPNYYGPGFFKKEVFDNVTNTTSTHTFIRVLKDDDKINLWMNLNDTMTKLILNSNTNSTNSSNSSDINQTLSPLLTADPEIKLGTGPSSSSALTTNAALLTSWNTTGPSWEFDSASQTAVVGPCFGLLDELIVLTDIMHMEMRQNFENWEDEFMEHVYKTQYEGICDIPKVTREKCGSSSANRNGSPGQSNNILLPKQWDWNETKWNNSNWGPNAGAGSGNEYNQFMVYLKWSKQQNDQDTFDLIDESFYNLEEIKCNTLSSSSNPISQECRESLEHDWIQKKMHKPVDAPPGPQSGDILDMAPNIDCLQVLRKIADSNNTSNCSFSQVIYNPELIPTTQMFQFGRPNDSSITANETKQLVCDSESITPQCRKSIKQWIGTEIENQASSSEIGQKCQQWLNSTVIFGSHVNKSDQTNNYSLDSILIENSCRQTRSSTILHYDYMLDLEPWKPTTTTTTPRPLDRPYGWRTEGVELLQINQLGQVTVKTAESFGLWPDWDNDQPTEIDNQDLLSSNLQKQDSAAATVDVDISHCNGYYSLAPISLRSLDKLEAIHGKFGADKKYISQQYSKNDYHGIGQAYPTLDNQKDEEFYEGAVFFGQTHKYAADFTSVIKIDVLDEQESIMRGRIMLLEGQKFGGRGEPVCIWTLVCPRKDSLNRTYMNSNDKTTFWQYYDTRYNNDIASIASFQQDSFEKNRLFEKNVVLQTVNDKIGRWDWSKMDFASLTESAIVEDQARTGSEGGPVLEFEKYAILDAIQGIVDWESNVDKIQQFSVSTNAQQQADIVKNCRYRSSNDINTIVSQLYNSDTSYFNNLAILDANVGATSDQAQRLTQLNTLMDQKHLINPTPETGSSVGDKRIYMHDFLEEMSLEGQISQAKLEQMQGTIKFPTDLIGWIQNEINEDSQQGMKFSQVEQIINSACKFDASGTMKSAILMTLKFQLSPGFRVPQTIDDMLPIDQGPGLNSKYYFLIKTPLPPSELYANVHSFTEGGQNFPQLRTLHRKQGPKSGEKIPLPIGGLNPYAHDSDDPLDKPDFVDALEDYKTRSIGQSCLRKKYDFMLKPNVCFEWMKFDSTKKYSYDGLGLEVKSSASERCKQECVNWRIKQIRHYTTQTDQSSVDSDCNDVEQKYLAKNTNCNKADPPFNEYPHEDPKTLVTQQETQAQQWQQFHLSSQNAAAEAAVTHHQSEHVVQVHNGAFNPSNGGGNAPAQQSSQHQYVYPVTHPQETRTVQSHGDVHNTGVGGSGGGSGTGSEASGGSSSGGKSGSGSGSTGGAIADASATTVTTPAPEPVTYKSSQLMDNCNPGEHGDCIADASGASHHNDLESENTNVDKIVTNDGPSISNKASSSKKSNKTNSKSDESSEDVNDDDSNDSNDDDETAKKVGLGIGGGTLGLIGLGGVAYAYSQGMIGGGEEEGEGGGGDEEKE